MTDWDRGPDHTNDSEYNRPKTARLTDHLWACETCY